MTFSQLKSPGVTLLKGRVSRREGKRDEEKKPGIPSWAGPAWLCSESLGPVFPAAVGNKASHSTTWAGREGRANSLGNHINTGS